MIKLNRDKCTGCGACIQRCPRQCIGWENGEFDFRYPQIDTDRCIECGLCEKACPIDTERAALPNQKAYAAVHESTDVLKRSTSGGAFTAIAHAIFARGGVVYGATMGKKMRVFHMRIESESDLDKLRGSKYIQSDIGSTYQQAESDLKSGRTVLYTGTPCQIDGLHHFLGKGYKNLYTADVVCHGVGSQAYFDKYMEYAHKRYGNVQEIRFRSKEYAGWGVGGTITAVSHHPPKSETMAYRDFNNYYYAYFLRGDIYRKCCYACQYANMNRPGDFTMGDYWGVEALHLSLDTAAGCSLLLVNNDHAEALIKEIHDLHLIETTLEQATHCNGQLKGATKLSSKRARLLAEYESMDGKQIQKEYMKSEKEYVIKGAVKALIPYRIKLQLRRLRR